MVHLPRSRAKRHEAFRPLHEPSCLFVGYFCNSSTTSAAILRAVSNSSGASEIAATTACPPPPYRSQIAARSCVRGRGDQGFEPTEIFDRNDDWLTLTL